MVLSQSSDHQRKIAILNDAFRSTFLCGSVCVTAGVHLLGNGFVKAALLAVRDFDRFEDANDPYDEHDFGSLVVLERKLFWKIDYYDPSMTHGSEDPANGEITRRVLTVMLAEEY
ncbi:DUF3768 domain-containing protein [Allomesorhizobium alhagi]|uniref:DUF3768 domain-containing protein n=1 Tax=Mesorhizobium alhagi CCNWXJ12-2 TaxID=1107882 RepID=H0HQB8_9HYPH|nr:DUF3768 domain-containing protein [Mesorhizobium alhagi]EHK57090.1 hypothetical protein MAXJ12_11742 [Mesorhizobium alhagi CCNWXJ12-2]